MGEMDSVYSEIATKKVKYDHLFNVCTSLLKSWPDRDDAGKPIPKEQRLSQEGERTKDSESTAKIEMVDKALEEMQLLDAVLQKAEKVRAAPQSKPKATSFPSDKPKTSSLSSKSSQQAAKVYKQTAVNTQKSTRRVNSSSKGGPKAAVVTGERKKSASSAKVTVKQSEHLPRSAKSLNRTDRLSAKTQPLSEKAEDIQRKAWNSSTPISRESEREVNPDFKEAFDIKKNGTKLNMPSRYYKLQRALCKLSEQQPYQQGTSVAGQRFCKRLSSHSEPDSLQRICNTLLAQELCWVKKRLLSLTPQELTDNVLQTILYLLAVNERNPWEDVWRIKTTLEALTEHAQKIRDTGSEAKGTPTDPLLKEDVRRKAVTHTAPKTLAYSSLEEWESMATAELQLMFSRYELDLLEFVNQKLLPLLPITDCPTHMLQTIYELAGISKPIFVKLSDNES